MQITKKDPSVAEREEMDKISRVWVSIARRDIPKHHRTFNNLHRRQQADAKRCSENCQREVSYSFSFLFPKKDISLVASFMLFWGFHDTQVKLKVARSFKFMRGASVRTRKLARDMLAYWKKADKEQVSNCLF